MIRTSQINVNHDDHTGSFTAYISWQQVSPEMIIKEVMEGHGKTLPEALHKLANTIEASKENLVTA